ncbi:MAG: V4R domain-containing protein [Hydrogenothermaceae bacterium]
MIEDIAKVNRPILGEEIPLLIFRAFRHFSANYAKDLIGEKGANIIFQNAGKDLGKELSNLVYDSNIEKYLDNIKNFVKDNKIGILIPVELSNNKIILALDECITCAGMPNIGQRICHFEVGFTAGLVEAFLHKKVKAFESKCGANGEGICEVTLEI